MNYASVLLHIEDSSHRPALTDVALALCSEHDAFLTALHVYIPDYHSHLPRGGYPVAQSPESVQRAEAQAKQRDARFEADFDKRARRFPATQTEWRFHLGELAETHLAPTLALHAQCADLVIMGQHDGHDRYSQTTYDTPAVVALASARPVLVLPHNRHFQTVGRRIVLAWDASVEATRMTSAVLPMLARAESVDVVMVNEGKTMTPALGDAPGADIALYLARHGVEVTVRQLERHGSSVAETLLSALSERDADLLCAGAYGHSRLREIAFGGVTFDLMRYMTVPTLIAC
jgi:nucleotide-binding universal stress UspA family protein